MVGDQADMVARLKRYLPRSWFGYTADPTPVLDSLLAGIAASLSWAYSLYAFAKLQTRIATSTGGWLELSAYDHFGDDFPRFQGESDASYSHRIRQEVLRKRQTRGAIDSAIFDLTGVHPHIFEGFHAPTTGGWGSRSLAFGRAGRYGSRTAPAHVIVTTPRPQNYGIPRRGGWGSGVGGLGIGNLSFVDDTLLQGSGPQIADILKAVDRVRAAGVTIIVRFTNPVGTGDPTP